MWRSLKGQEELAFFFFMLAVFVVIVLMIIVAVFASLGITNIQHILKINMELSDRARMPLVLLSSGGEVNNMELLGHYLSSNFGRTGLEPLRKTLQYIGGKYIGINKQDIEGTKMDVKTGFTADIPVPGAGMAPEGAKARVTVG